VYEEFQHCFRSSTVASNRFFSVPLQLSSSTEVNFLIPEVNKACEDKTPDGFLANLAYVTRATSFSMNLNVVIKMHTAAMVAANQLANLLANAVLHEA